MKNKITIAIDGHSSTGKSTLARQLAQALNYVYVDSGAMYRAVTLFAMKEGIIGPEFFKTDELLEKLNEIRLDFVYNPELGFAEMFLNGINVEREIRSIEVSGFVSKIAAVSAVRSLLVAQQQRLGAEKGVVMDGRDIGTVVFPNAELKIFMTASAQTRAQRRYEELRAQGQPATYEAVLQNVQQRDFIDSTREDSPLKMAGDAVEIDNSNLTKQEQFDQVLQLVQQKLG